MSGGSLGLGIRSASYGSLEKLSLQNNSVLPIQTGRKPSKVVKDKEHLFHWICKSAGRKKVGMLLLCIVSVLVFIFDLSIGIGKGYDTRVTEHVQNINLNKYVFISHPGSSSVNGVQSEDSMSTALPPPPAPLRPPPPAPLRPPPPAILLGYTLPPGHPCNSFTLPPPPADKKRTGPRPCPVCYLPVEEAIALMPKVSSDSPVIKNLTYIYEENLNRETEFGGSDFGGYPTLAQRADSYDIRESMSVHCGFVKGVKPGCNTGYDMDDDDLLEMEQCHGIVVASAIFGNFDDINQPTNISDYAKETVCFYMFIDEETEAYMKVTGTLGSSKKVGLWRVVVVHNLPFSDGRRNGKIPKLLLHRMFPNTRFSLWIDGKLELVVDPYQILERFLWRKNATFAISRHYKRFDTFTEAEANKAAGKYDNASIDFQIEFYVKEGLTPYSEAKLPITSDVPEGCVIIREHVPVSNLFNCLWFNEVDRFTSRDQISFSTVRDKIRAKTNWTINMFLDCERRNFVVQKYHRDVLEHMVSHVPDSVYSPSPPLLLPPPPVETSPERVVSMPIRKVSPRRRGRSSSRRHRKIVAGSNTNNIGLS